MFRNKRVHAGKGRWAVWWPSALAFGLMFTGTDARADGWSQGPYEYRTDDPTPIRVEFARAGRTLVMHVPRSAILFVANYDARETPVLPDITVDGTFRLGLTAPAGTPIGEADEYSMSDADFRRARTMVEVSPTTPDLTDDRLYHFLFSHPEGFALAEARPFDGLDASEIRRYAVLPDGRVDREHYTSYNDRLYFRGSSDDLFDYINCSGSNSHAIVFCDYFVRVNDLVLLKVSFVDFRFNGGRAFAAERMRMVVAAYCGYAQDRESARCVKASGMTHDAD
jgi:hypothetical protein